MEKIDIAALREGDKKLFEAFDRALGDYMKANEFLLKGLKDLENLSENLTKLEL